MSKATDFLDILKTSRNMSVAFYHTHLVFMYCHGVVVFVSMCLCFCRCVCVFVDVFVYCHGVDVFVFVFVLMCLCLCRCVCVLSRCRCQNGCQCRLSLHGCNLPPAIPDRKHQRTAVQCLMCSQQFCSLHITHFTVCTFHCTL